jgi:plasmid stabilization system protein ParE
MSRTVVVDEEAAEEAEAQAQYYAERAGEDVALRFAAEIEAIYRGLADRRLVGVNHQRVYVVAIEALRKQPGYWRARLRSR